MSDVLRRIASLAHSLSQAELRVLLELAARAEASGASEAASSSRDLARITGLARASVQAAVDALNAKGLLQSDAGSPTRPAVHRLVCLQREAGSGPVSGPEVAQPLSHPGLAIKPQVVVELGHRGLVTGPGVAQPVSHGGPAAEPEVAQEVGHAGPMSEPPRNEKSAVYEERIKERARMCVDSIDFNFDKTIDRLQAASKSDFDESIFEVARMKIASHHAKYAREENRLSTLPDDAITAQFLAVAEWPKLDGLLYELAAERKEAGYSYGWYVTVALQRIHGLSPARLREMRTRLRPSGNGSRNVSTAQRPALQCSREAYHRKPSGRERGADPSQRVDTEQLKQQIRAVAAAKSM